MKYAFLLPLVLMVASLDAMAVDRSTTERYAFDRMTPCPVAWTKPHVCPGHVRDHTIALRCARSPEERKWLDSRYNMQWQSIAEGKAKDKWEGTTCLHGFKAPR